MRDRPGTSSTGIEAAGATAHSSDRELTVATETAWRAFGTERDDSQQPSSGNPNKISSWVPFDRARTSWLWPMLFVLGVSAAVGSYVLWNRADATSATVGTGTATASINSRPEGLQVVIDDEVRGATPLKLALPVGNHKLQIQTGTEVRTIPLVIESGTAASHYIDFASTTPTPAGTSEAGSNASAAGANVRGAVPAVPAVTAGERQIGGPTDTSAGRGITVPPAAPASTVATINPVPPSLMGGWVSFKVPFEMQVFEAGRLIGTTSMDRVMLPIGSHTLDFVNTSLEFRTSASVQVRTGATTTPLVAVPNGSLSVNALPWADVEIDGQPVGTTPLANITVPVGPHELVLKHPQGGERRRTVDVTAKTPVRIGVDFSQ